MADKQTYARAKLKLADGSGPDAELVFPLNPNRVQRSLAPRYVDAPIAGADYTAWSAPGNPPPFQWISNKDELIHVEFLLIPAIDSVPIIVGNGISQMALDSDVETELKRLDNFMSVDRSTGEPFNLIFTWGPRMDLVRIISKDVEEKLWTGTLAVKQATVRLTMRTLRMRTS